MKNKYNNYNIKPGNILLSHDIIKHLSINERIIMQNNFDVKSNFSLSEKDQDTIKELIDNSIYYLFEGSFDTINQQREYRKDTILNLIKKDIYLTSKINFGRRINDWKDFVREICDLLFINNIRNRISINNFFNISIIESIDFLSCNEYYYKGIGTNILFMRQIICEDFKFFDEFLDYFSPEYGTALSFAHGFGKYSNPKEIGYILCINKEKILQHLNNINHIKGIQINNQDKSNYYLYHTIIPIHCVDKIIKIAPKKL